MIGFMNEKRKIFLNPTCRDIPFSVLSKMEVVSQHKCAGLRHQNRALCKLDLSGPL